MEGYIQDVLICLYIVSKNWTWNQNLSLVHQEQLERIEHIDDLAWGLKAHIMPYDFIWPFARSFRLDKANVCSVAGLVASRRSAGKRDSKTQPEVPEDTFEAHSFLPAFFIFLAGSKCQDAAIKKRLVKVLQALTNVLNCSNISSLKTINDDLFLSFLLKNHCFDLPLSPEQPTHKGHFANGWKGATGEDPINLAHLLDQHLCSV